MGLQKLEFLRYGSAKDIYRVNQTDIAFRFSDFFSVFDVGRSQDQIPGKAKAICACAVKSFMIAQEIGVPTHFVEQLDDVTIRVKEAQIITNRFIGVHDKNYLLPGEFIYRWFVAGSIHRAFETGKKNPEDYGLPAGVPVVGTPFPSPVHHLTTKFEKTDRDIDTEKEFCQMAGIALRDLYEYWSLIDHLMGAVRLEMARVGFGLLDGKLECIMGPTRNKLIGDVFCTPDEDRPVPLDKLKQGKVEHYSKEYIRQFFIKEGYFDELKQARAAGKPDPPLPRLPEKEIEIISHRYLTMAKAYSGVNLS